MTLVELILIIFVFFFVCLVAVIVNRRRASPLVIIRPDCQYPPSEEARKQRESWQVLINTGQAKPENFNKFYLLNEVK